MTFAKIIDNTIQVYPYFPQVEYPLTSFPIGNDYPQFNTYWIHPKTPSNPNPEVYDSVETTPIYNGTHWEQAWDFIEKPPKPPQANWDNFNLQMMSNSRFNQVYNQCLSVAPIICSALPTALDQVSSKGLSLFTLIWTQLCQIGGATEDDKLVWGGYAIENNLPQDFIDILIN